MFGKKKILNLKSSYLRYFKGKMMIKSILIHEYQHGSTRINTSPTRINTSQHESKTSNDLPEAATRGVLCKKVFLEISQNS